MSCGVYAAYTPQLIDTNNSGATNSDMLTLRQRWHITICSVTANMTIDTINMLQKADDDDVRLLRARGVRKTSEQFVSKHCDLTRTVDGWFSSRREKYSNDCKNKLKK